MRLARAGAAAATATVAAALALLSAPAAHADGVVPYIHLKVSVVGPRFGDATDKMFYALHVDSSPDSQAAATGLVLKLTELSCSTPTTPDALCEHRMTVWYPVGDVPAGGHVTQLLQVNLPNNQQKVWLRLAPEIAKADQLILGDAPGTCVYGHHETDLCAATTYALLP
jgi:hypothetical protein